MSRSGSESQIGDLEAVDFVLKLGRALHQYGSAAHRLEDVLCHVARKDWARSSGLFATNLDLRFIWFTTSSAHVHDSGESGRGKSRKALGCG